MQLALQPEMALAARIAGAAGDDDDEPLAAQRERRDRLRREVGQRQRGRAAGRGGTISSL